MKSVRTKEFKELFAKLPRDVQKQAIEAYHIFEVDPYYPGLHFECINYEVAHLLWFDTVFLRLPLLLLSGVVSLGVFAWFPPSPDSFPHFQKHCVIVLKGS